MIIKKQSTEFIEVEESLPFYASIQDTDKLTELFVKITETEMIQIKNDIFGYSFSKYKVHTEEGIAEIWYNNKITREYFNENLEFAKNFIASL